MIVIGKVGCGKTTLLYSIMDETKKVNGFHNVQGKIAYVEQEPFILSGSIKDNILFGLRYDEDKLQEVIRVC
jgi:ABC-type multidrug transport system fused ATPase/permease subunit